MQVQYYKCHGEKEGYTVFTAPADDNTAAVWDFDPDELLLELSKPAELRIGRSRVFWHFVEIKGKKLELEGSKIAINQ